MKGFRKAFCSMFAVLIAAVMSLTLCVGCSGKGPNNGDTSVLTISFWKAGWGDEYLKEIVADFELAYPQYTVDLQSSTDGFVYANTIELGAEINDIDLYIASFMNTPYDEYSEPLNDLLNEKCYGDNVTVGEKLGATLRDGLKYPDGNIYGMPEVIGTSQGLVYNADWIGEGTDYAIPVTTDELETLVSELSYDENFKNIKPFIHYGQGDYWQRVYQQWWVQYEGLDAYYDFLRLKDGSGQSPSKDVLTAEDGRYKALSVLDSILSEDTVYAGSNNLTYQQAQTFFMNGSAVMMANGNWLINEMKSNTEATSKNLKMMRTPVISSIIEKCDSIEDDAELAALIRKIDEDTASGRADALSGNGFSVTKEDYERVFAARYYTAPANDASLMVIPEYSTMKDAAKEFIKFYYSDASLSKVSSKLHCPITMECTNLTVDRSAWLPFEKECWDLVAHDIMVLGEAVGIKNDVFTYGGMLVWNASPVVAFSQHNRTDLNTYWNNLISYYEGQWQTSLDNVAARE